MHATGTALFMHVGREDPLVPLAPPDQYQAFQQLIELRCYVSGRDSSQGRFWASSSLGQAEVTIGAWPIGN